MVSCWSRQALPHPEGAAQAVPARDRSVAQEQVGPLRIFGVILAGGTGRRMGGGDKALMGLGGIPLVQRAKERLAPQVDAVALSANGGADRFDFLGLPVLGDDPVITSRGPLSGVLAALEWAGASRATHVVSVAVDTPFFPCDLVPQLYLAAEGSPSRLAIARSAGRDHPTFGLWPVALLADLRTYLAQASSARVLDFADQHRAARADFPDPMMFTNLNTLQDLAEAESRLIGRG